LAADVKALRREATPCTNVGDSGTPCRLQYVDAVRHLSPCRRVEEIEGDDIEPLFREKPRDRRHERMGLWSPCPVRENERRSHGLRGAINDGRGLTVFTDFEFERRGSSHEASVHRTACACREKNAHIARRS